MHGENRFKILLLSRKIACGPIHVPDSIEGQKMRRSERYGKKDSKRITAKSKEPRRKPGGNL